MRKVSYLNGVLTVIAVMLTLLLVDRLTSRDASVLVGPAYAEPPTRDGGMVSAGEQRKMMIAELKKLTQKLEVLDHHLTSGTLRVKVTDMPPVKMVEPEPKKGE